MRALSPAVASTLKALQAESRGLQDVIITQVDELLPLKNKLDELRKRVKEIKRAMTDILNNDEDMAMMYLEDDETSSAAVAVAAPIATDSRDAVENSSISPPAATLIVDEEDTTVPVDPLRAPSTTVQPQQQQTAASTMNIMNLEMMFENYLNEIEWISSEIDEVIDEIVNTEENVVLQIDLLRNRILKFELILSISSFVVTCGALVTGLFGMNLLNHFETNKSLFYVVTVVICVGMSSIFRAFTRYAKREKLF